MVHVDQGEAALQNLSSGRVLNCEVKSMDKRKCLYINYAKSLQSEIFFQKERHVFKSAYIIRYNNHIHIIDKVVDYISCMIIQKSMARLLLDRLLMERN